MSQIGILSVSVVFNILQHPLNPLKGLPDWQAGYDNPLCMDGLRDDYGDDEFPLLVYV